MKDVNGRVYAKVYAVRVGDKLQFDGGFSCIPSNAIREVMGDRNGLYVTCSCGRHYLGGQVKKGYYVGCYVANPFF